jgi:hypothetical protein
MAGCKSYYYADWAVDFEFADVSANVSSAFDGLRVRADSVSFISSLAS